MILSFSHGPDFAAGGQMRSEQWTAPISQAESLFQSKVRDGNFQKKSIRGSCFRKNGLTEVFRRRSSGGKVIAWTGNQPGYRDVPGGALRFRLRAHADVMVFFTASIHRINHWDYSRKGMSALDDGKLPYAWSNVCFRSLWEGGDKEPGEELVQAQSICYQRAASVLTGNRYLDRVGTPRGLFLCFKINPHDVGQAVPSRSPENVVFANEDKSVTTHGVAGSEMIDMEELRMVSPSLALQSSQDSMGAADSGRLLPGWHNIRHTFHYTLPSYDTGTTRHTQMGFVFGNTELVVVADYGPRESERQRGAKKDTQDKNNLVDAFVQTLGPGQDGFSWG